MAAKRKKGVSKAVPSRSAQRPYILVPGDQAEVAEAVANLRHRRPPAIKPGRVPGDQADVRVALAYLRGHSSWVCLAPGDAGDRGQLHPRAGAKTSGGMSGVMNV